MRTIHTAIALLMLILTGAAFGGQQHAVAQGGSAKTLTTYVRLCTGPQCLNDYNQTELASGVSVTLTDADSNTVIGSCATDQTGSCTLDVSGSTGVYIDLDPATFPEGYRVLEGMPHITPLDQPASEATVVLQPNAGIPTPETPAFDVSIHVNKCIAPGCSELPNAIAPVDGVEVDVSNAADGALLQSCTTGETGSGTCPVNTLGVTSLSVMVNTNTMPDGYSVRPNPSVVQVSPDDPNVWILFLPVDGFPTIEPVVSPTVAATVPPMPLPEPLALELPAVLAASSCADVDGGQTGDALSDLTIVEGETRGSAQALAAASSYSVLPMPVADLLSSDHAIAVFASDDSGTVIACGDIGGVLDQQGTLSIGLAPVGDSGAAGMAYLAPRGDGETGLSLFLVPNGLIPTPDASPTPMS